jgi:hypothetical protein
MVRDKSHSPNFAGLRASKKYRLISPALARPRACFAAAVERWPTAKLTLRNGARIIERTWPADD